MAGTQQGAVPPQLLVALAPEPDADADEVDRLARQLRSELRDLDVGEVTETGGRPAPEGAKGADAASVGEWLVTLSAGGGVFVSVIAALREWLGRRQGAHRVTVTLDGDTLELSSASSAEQTRLIEAFLREHPRV
jgi:hypothetical protein